MSRPDAELVARCRAGDSDAFEVLYREHSPRLYALARRMTGSPHALSARDSPATPPMPVFDFDADDLKAQIDAFKFDVDRFKDDVLEGVKVDIDDLKLDLAFEFAQGPELAQGPNPNPKVMIARGRDDNDDRNYQNGTRADGPMYWIAWARNKQGNGAAALEWLATIPKESRWTAEAGALSVEIRQRAGQPVKPENVPDEELRLMALNSLARADDQRAIPMLEKIVNGTGSPRLKERALFVLAQNGSPEARQIVIRIARGGNPDLQARAVQHAGAFGGPESKQALLDIFKSTSNVTVKRNILRSFMSTGDRAQLLDVARTEPLPELRAEAVQQLGAMGAQEQLAQLYATEKTIEVRRRIIQAMFQRNNPDSLIQLLKTETESELRRTIVQNLGQMGSPQGTAALQSIYASEKDEAVKRAVVDAFATRTMQRC